MARGRARERREQRREERRQHELDKITLRQEAKTERNENKFDAASIAYAQGIDPNASKAAMFSSIASGLGSVAGVISGGAGGGLGAGRRSEAPSGAEERGFMGGLNLDGFLGGKPFSFGANAGPSTGAIIGIAAILVLLLDPFKLFKKRGRKR